MVLPVDKFMELNGQVGFFESDREYPVSPGYPNRHLDRLEKEIHKARPIGLAAVRWDPYSQSYVTTGRSNYAETNSD